MKDLNMPAAETGAGILLMKFGVLKLLGFGAALIGAGMMAAFRPPKSRKELFTQGAVALGSSLLFGGTLVKAAASFTGLVDLSTGSLEDVGQFTAMVYGLIGALSWGLFGGLAVLRDKVGTDPIQVVKDVKNL